MQSQTLQLAAAAAAEVAAVAVVAAALRMSACGEVGGRMWRAQTSSSRPCAC